MRGGYVGQLLRVDLTRGTSAVAPLPDEDVLRRFVGGVGLAVWLVAQEAPLDTSATSPEAPLIFMTGPLTGTLAPSSADFSVVGLNHDTPYAVATGHSHGFWGAYLKLAGFDGIVITGRAAEPVYLWIDDGKVELRPAPHLWGQDTRETERRVKAELGDPNRISVAAIGPAGEAQLHGASIKNDRNHGAAKGGVGAVMGSKQLKAIAVRGAGTVPLAGPERFQAAVTEWSESLFRVPAGERPPANAARALKDAGILRGYRAIGRHSLLAGKNLTDPDWGQRYADNVSRDAKEWVVTPQPSFNCAIGCAYDARITTGPFSGYTVSLCGGGENTEGAAAMIGVEDAGTALVLTDYYDAIGMDSSVAGCVISMAFELYNRGLLTKEQTDGLELTWGNHEAAMELLDRMIRREGFGAVLAQGMKAAAASLGPEAERALVHVKGSGMNLHDWRAAWSVLLGQVVAAASACWQGTGADALGLEPDLGYRTFTRNDDLAGKPESVRRTQIKKLFDDCLGICWFATWGVENVTKLAPAALAAATGWDDFDTAEAFAVGERVINLERLIACRRGFTISDEWDVSPRLLEAPPTGRAAGTAFGPHLKALVHEYYDLMGWDKATGRPLPATLERLGLADAIVT